jgi:hypothetical protein
VVGTEGYFDVFPPADRLPGAKPAYRGRIAELGSTCSQGEKLTVRPDSPVLDAAVCMWARRHGSAAVKGELGFGRNEFMAPSTPVAAAGSKGSKPEPQPTSAGSAS